MSDIDELLRKRLDKLRAEDSDELPPPKPSTSGYLPKPNKKTAPEQVEDLLAQLSDETSLQSKEKDRAIDIDSQLKSRLERLKSREGCEFLSSTGSSIPKSATKDELTDEEFFDTCACTDLLADLGHDSDKDSLSEDSSNSGTLCGVCDERKPSLICVDCDKDYYCHKCFKEFHDDEDDKHKTVPYAK